MSSAAGSRERSAAAAMSTISSGTRPADSGATGAAGTPPSSHETSAGSTSDATRPGGDRAADTASAASRGSEAVEADDRNQAETLRARDSMSDVSGASYWRW